MKRQRETRGLYGGYAIELSVLIRRPAVNLV